MKISSTDLNQQQQFFQNNGYVVVRNLFSTEEATALRDHYMALRAQGTWPGDFDGVDTTSADPLKKYPRMIHMHRWDDASLQWAMDPRLARTMTACLGEEPFLGQTMIYFKPAGARGQALHQDNFYLKVEPGTTMAAWMALDSIDEENGCMQVVPGSHTWPILCPMTADTKLSFTDVTVPLPPGTESVPILMEPGDVLFFNGSLVHGSYPNTSKDRFRRALIGHYVTGDAEQASSWMYPLYRFDGSQFELKDNPGGGPCGVWVARDETHAVEMTGKLENEGVVTEK